MTNGENDDTLNEAMARLDAAEAGEKPLTIPNEQVQSEDGAQQATPPEPTPAEGAETPDTLPADTQAAAEPKPTEPKTQTPPKQQSQSPLAKDKQRRDDSWKALNTQKTAFEQQQAELKAQREAHQRQVEQWNVQQAKARNQFTPEQIEQTAQQRQGQAVQLNEQADAWDARAEKLENEGDVKGAVKAKANADLLREQAAEQKAMAKTLQQHAQRLRSQPADPTLEQHKAKLDQQMRGYTLKAVELWPEFGKQGSEFQKQVATGLQEARKIGLEVNDNPALLYYAARLVAGETAAARVPAMEKELGTLRARVKELEGLTAPGGGQPAVQRQTTQSGPKTLEEEGEELRSMAANL